MVTGQVGLALHSVDDEELGLVSWGRSELDVRGEGRPSEADDPSSGDGAGDLLGAKRAVADQLGAAVYALLPLLLSSDSDDDGRALVAPSVVDGVDLGDLARD